MRYAVDVTYIDGSQESESGIWCQTLDEFLAVIEKLEQDEEIAQVSYTINQEDVA